MNTLQLIKQVMHSARHLVGHGVKEMRIPVLLYRDWLEYYEREDSPALRESRRLEQKRDWYLAHFLRREGVKVEFVLISREELFSGLSRLESPAESARDKRTALNRLAQMGVGTPPPCRHLYVPRADETGRTLGTVTLMGEADEEAPEIMSAVVHLEDGSPLSYTNLLTIDYTPQQAHEACLTFFQDHGVEEIFTTPGVLPPTFCEDCGELLVKVADPREVEIIMAAQEPPE